MNAETENLVRELALKMGTTSEYLWGILVRQARVEALCKLSTTLFAGVVLAVWILILRKLMRSDSTIWRYNEDNSGPIPIIACFVTGAVVFVWASFVIVETWASIAALLNPEYWALKQLLP